MAEPTKKGKRQYRMRARAESSAATRERILDAGEVAFDELRFDEITLAWVAERAGVSVQTVIRHFGTKDGLFMAILGRTGAKMAGDRDVPPGATVKEVVDILIDHYEEFGGRVLRMLSQEERVPQLHLLADLGRSYHLEWCRQAFAPGLKGLRGARRERRVMQLAAVTDIYVWRIFRQDRGLSAPQTKLAVRELVEALLERPR
jgi:AcrR family transcriptional regulator